MEGKGSQTLGRAQPESWSVFNKQLPKKGERNTWDRKKATWRGKGLGYMTGS